jgi:hypothetical protein
MWVPAGPAVKEGYAKGSSAPVHRSKSMFLAYHLRAQQLIFDLSPQWIYRLQAIHPRFIGERYTVEHGPAPLVLYVVPFPGAGPDLSLKTLPHE